MREYGKVSPQFWTGATGKAIKAHGPEAVVVALYLMTSPHANMIGLYHLPVMYLAHETGMTIEGASKGLARCSEALLCSYDEATEHVWVHEMARFQIADTLLLKDKRCKGVANELAKLPETPLKQGFLNRYAEAFHLENSKGHGRGFKAPTKPRAGAGAGTGARKSTLAQPAEPSAAFVKFWTEYPVKKGKTAALKTWGARNLDAIADRILGDVKARKAGDRQWLDGYAPHASTYVNQSVWEDAIEPPRPKLAAVGGSGYTPLPGER